MDKKVFHELTSENIQFKALNIKDTEAIHEYASDPDVKRFIGWPLSKTLEDTRDLVNDMIKKEEVGTHLYASVSEKTTDKIIGTVMIFNFDKDANHGEIGYVFHRSYWNQGYCSKSIALLASYAFNNAHLRKLHARVVNANMGSIKVLEKNGFTKEGLLKDYYNIEGNYYDLILFAKFAPGVERT